MIVSVSDETAVRTTRIDMGGKPDVVADGPREFCWQGRRYRIRGILSHHRVSKEVWRVTASAAPPKEHPGVFDMQLDWNTGQWTIHRVRVLHGEAESPPSMQSSEESS